MLLILSVLLTVACVLSNASEVRDPHPSSFQLVILHHNDVNAHYEQISKVSGVCTPDDREIGNCLGGFPRVAHVVKEHRAAAMKGDAPVLYLNAGDTYAGTAWRALYDWRFAADFVNALQPDALSLGTNDIANEESKLSPLLENINVPILVSNIILKSDNKVLKIEKSLVFDIDGVKVGVIGYLHPTNKLLIQQDIEYIDEIKAVNAEANLLKSQGVGIIIALGHSSLEKDIEIAREVLNIDLVIGGYKNAYFWNGINEQKFEEQKETVIVQQRSGRIIPVFQSYTYSEYLGKVHLSFDDKGELIEYDNTPILLDEMPQDDEVLKIINSHNVNMNVVNEMIGQTSVPLYRDTCGMEECELGNLITDAMLYKFKLDSESQKTLETPAATIPSGCIASSIKSPTAIKTNDLVKILPAESTVFAVTMKGEILKRVLEHSVSNYDLDNPSTRFLQYSGMNVVYDLSRPVGSRILNALIGCSSSYDLKCNTIKASSNYTILMPSTMAQGAHGYTMLVGLPVEEQNYDELTSLRDYIKENTPVYPKPNERIMILNIDFLNNGTNATVSDNTTVTTATVTTITPLPTTSPETTTPQVTTAATVTVTPGNTTISENTTTPVTITTVPTTVTTPTTITTPATTTISQNTTTPVNITTVPTTVTTPTTVITPAATTISQNTTTPVPVTSPPTTTLTPGTTPSSASSLQSSQITLSLSLIYFTVCSINK